MNGKKMRKTLCLTLTVLLSGLFAACGGTGTGMSTGSDIGDSSSSQNPPVSQTITNKTYQSYWMKQFDYKTMPIAAFNGAPIQIGAYTQTMITDEHFKTMSEAYFNTTYAMYDHANNKEVSNALKYAEKYNISYMAILGGGLPTDINILETQIYNTLIKDKPKALGGVLISDEPGRLLFESVANARDLYKTLLGKKVLFHCNLYPSHAATWGLYGSKDLPAEGYTYEQYVEEFLEIYDPQVLSYDYYPLNAKGTIAQPYFENMSFIREKAAEREIPFWVYVQSCSYSKNTRIPTEADIGWLVNTSLAYGAKGIQYFCYVDPLSGGEVFQGSPIGTDGKKTDTYYHAQKANKFVSEVDEVLMCCLSKGLIAAGDSPCPIPEKDLLSSYGALKKVEGESVLAGCFDYNGRDAYYVVNNSISGSCTAKLTFDGEANGFLQTASGKTDVVQKSTLEIELEAGKAALIVLN